jgi:NAD(P)-dependent dehydrogenase (short-subunit alcohol dehydrogenase family)
MNESQPLHNQVCLITGGGTGIGHGLALAVARAGAPVAVMGRRQAPLQETVAAIEQAGGVARAFPGDVAREDDVARIVRATEEALGPITILVNNAGIGGGREVHNHSVEDWDRIMAINLRGPFLMARAVLPGMRRRRRGHIVNISSESGLEYYAGDGAYGISKHALNALGEYIQRENQELGIRVDTICPGMVVTEMSENSPGLDHAKCLYPDDIAELVLWLLTRRPNVKIGRPLLIQTMENPWTWD